MHEASRTTHPISAESFLLEVDHAFDLLTLNQLPVHPSSRFAAYRNLLRKVYAGTELQNSVRAHAHLELDQLLKITKQLLPTADEAMVRRFRRMLDGATTPEKPTSGANARDTQFELFLASMLKRGGLDVQFEEPDLVLDLGFRFIGIAAKRIRSPKKLKERLNEGRSQNLRQQAKNTHGIIAINVTQLMNPEHRVRISNDSHDNRNAAAELASDAYTQVAPLLEAWRGPDNFVRHTCAVLLVANAVAYQHEGHLVVTSTSTTSIRLDKHAGEVLDLIARSVMSSMPGVLDAKQWPQSS